LESGFSLIELMVVLLILAILLAIAVPVFLGTSTGADDRAAQSNLNTALTTAKEAANKNSQCYNTVCGGAVTVTAATLQRNEPSITFGDSAVETTQGPVSDYISPDGSGIVLASFSKNNNTCWLAVDNLTTIAAPPAGGGGAYGAAPLSASGSATKAPSKPGTWFSVSTGPCNAAATPTGASWSNQL